jgi:hypothetical protein
VSKDFTVTLKVIRSILIFVFMTNKRTRFVISVDGSPKTVFSVRETTSGDLNIHTTSGGKSYSGATLKELLILSDESLYEDCTTHISVHVSQRSDNTNTIKRTQSYQGRSETRMQVTTGMKKDNLFIPVVFKIAGDLSRPRYSVPEDLDDELISLGEYDPKLNQLRLMIVCSSDETQFPTIGDHPTNSISKSFSVFNLTLLWSYLNKPSHPQAVEFFISTQQDTGPIGGFDNCGIYNLYTDLNMVHANQYFLVYGDE